MKHLRCAEGEAALAAVLRLRPLLALDFDGTLAPIVARPDDARILPAVAQRLRRLAPRLPTAIVTGRAVDDVRARLGFEPRYIVGNHGAEGPPGTLSAAGRMRRLDPLRARLAAARERLERVGVTIEDKRLSIALHYRLSPWPAQALALIDELLTPLEPALRRFAGKMVANVAPADAPDKAQAVRALVARCGAGAAIFAGDDVNDEPVFAAAPAHWLTIRVGRDDPHSRARFGLDDPAEIVLLLDGMLDRLDTGAAG